MQVLFGLSSSSTAAAAVAELGSRKRRNAKLGADDCQVKVLTTAVQSSVSLLK